jgi:amidohydrolase
VVLAEVLAGRRSTLPGSMVFLFQPAEEIAQGALPMIEAGAMDHPRVDAVLGFHLANGLPTGVVALRAGPAMASMDEIGITVEGHGGHGAMPHLAIDPIVAAAHVVTALQAVVSRETSPLEAVVLTIGTIAGGTAFNIIPDRVEMRGTVRAFTDECRQRVLRRIEEVAAATAAAHRARAMVTHRFGCPPVVNDPRVTAVVEQVAAVVAGAERVRTAELWTASDDMAYFLQRAPGCYFNVGSQDAQRGLDAPHHNARFDFDEQAMAIATRVLGGAALRLLEATSEGV